jgi:hypothetical protein
MAEESEDQAEGRDHSVAESESQDDTEDLVEVAKGEVTEGPSDEEDEAVEDESDAEEEDEPKLKYARLTGHLGPVYRNGDATSAFLVAGDKMVCLQYLKFGYVLMRCSSLALTTAIL